MTHFSDTPTAIEIHGLSKSYGRKRVIRDFSIDLAEGEVLGFLGPNGAGHVHFLRSDGQQRVVYNRGRRPRPKNLR